jgi:hypothetical protein
MTTIKRRLVDEALLGMLVHELQFPVTFNRVPDNAHELQTYAVLTPIDSGETHGPPLAAPDADASLEYDITAVGQDDRQVSWVADQVRRVMLGRSASGSLLVDLIIEEHTAVDRWSPGPIGAPRLESGVYQAVDSYRLEVSRS